MILEKAFTKSPIINAFRSFTTILTPRVVLGTMTIGSVTNQEDATTTVLHFYDAKFKDLVPQDSMLDLEIMHQGGKMEVVLGDMTKK